MWNNSLKVLGVNYIILTGTGTYPLQVLLQFNVLSFLDLVVMGYYSQTNKTTVIGIYYLLRGRKFKSLFP